MFRRLTKAAITAAAFAAILSTAHADSNYWLLSSGDFSQDWTNTGLITANDNWSGVPSIMGYLGDTAPSTSITNVDPQTYLAPTLGAVDVIANQTNPNTTTAGGVGEYDGIANPTIALQGSGTADTPGLVLFVNSTGRQNVTISYKLRDIDGSSDNAIQQIALQYRLNETGNFINVPAAYVADATTGPSVATLVTPISASLAAWDNQAKIEFRIITTNAASNDEWVGVDDISVTSTVVPEPGSILALGSGLLGMIGMVIRRK